MPSSVCSSSVFSVSTVGAGRRSPALASKASALSTGSPCSSTLSAKASQASSSTAAAGVRVAGKAPSGSPWAETDYTSPTVPKHQRRYLPNLVEDKEDGEPKFGEKRATTVDSITGFERNKNAPSTITVMGNVDMVYHNPPADLLLREGIVVEGTEVDEERLDRIRRSQTWNSAPKAPMKLHHLENEEEALLLGDPEAVATGQGLPLPPKDVIGELLERAPVEQRLKRMQEALQYSNFSLRNKERELELLKRDRTVAKAKSKMSKGFAKSALNGNTMGVAAMEFPEDFTKVVRMERDKNILLKGKPSLEDKKMAAATKKKKGNGGNAAMQMLHMERPSHNEDPYVHGGSHKRVFTEKRNLLAPYPRDLKHEQYPSRKLGRTTIPSGTGVLTQFVEQESTRQRVAQEEIAKAKRRRFTGALPIESTPGHSGEGEAEQSANSGKKKKKVTVQARASSSLGPNSSTPPTASAEEGTGTSGGGTVKNVTIAAQTSGGEEDESK